MFGKKKSEFKTEAELQQYIDKKINNTIKSQVNNSASTVRAVLTQLIKESTQALEKIAHLEKFLGITFGTETTTGYKKVKKSKK